MIDWTLNLSWRLRDPPTPCTVTVPLMDSRGHVASCCWWSTHWMGGGSLLRGWLAVRRLDAQVNRRLFFSDAIFASLLRNCGRAHLPRMMGGWREDGRAAGCQTASGQQGKVLAGWIWDGSYHVQLILSFVGWVKTLQSLLQKQIDELIHESDWRLNTSDTAGVCMWALGSVIG